MKTEATDIAAATRAVATGPQWGRRGFLAGAAAMGAAPLALTACGGGDDADVASAVNTPTRFVEAKGRKLAYRSVGQGKPIVLAHRFRGVLDWWDPAFIDSLASKGFQVVTFDYSGMGQSTGTRTYDVVSLANDAKDLIDALGLKDVVIGGWSIGGMVAQTYLALYGATVTHVLLIGTTPPGLLVKTADPLFFQGAAAPVLDFQVFAGGFFEPTDAGSLAAAQRSWDRIKSRTGDRSPEIPADWAVAQLATLPLNPVFPADAVLAVLKTTRVPILHIGGDHDLPFPVENWYALNGQLPTLQLLTYPRSGHGPHQQYPQEASSAVAAFVAGSK